MDFMKQQQINAYPRCTFSKKHDEFVFIGWDLIRGVCGDSIGMTFLCKGIIPDFKSWTKEKCEYYLLSALLPHSKSNMEQISHSDTRIRCMEVCNKQELLQNFLSPCEDAKHLGFSTAFPWIPDKTLHKPGFSKTKLGPRF